MAVDTLDNFIGGTWLAAAGPASRPVEDPATGQVVCQVPRSGPADVERAVTVARDASLTWRMVPPARRARALAALAQRVDDEAEPLARVIALDTGKTLDEARAEVRLDIENVEHDALSVLMDGEAHVDVAAGLDGEALHQPVGVIALVTSASFPLLGPLGLLPYALACGDAVVLQPAAEAPLVARALFELVAEGGLARGVVNLIHGDGDTARALVGHPGVDGVACLGPRDAIEPCYRLALERDRRVVALASPRNLIAVAADADLDRAVAALVDAGFGHAGQRCLGGTEVIAVDEVADALIERLAAVAGRMVVGPGLEPGTALGAMPSGAALDRAISALVEAERAGARVVVDGRRAPRRQGRGHFLGPSLVTDLPDGVALAATGAGPTLVVRRVGTLDDALARLEVANPSHQAAIFTASGRVARAARIRAAARSFGVNVAMPAALPGFPLGGASGSFFADLGPHGRDAIRLFSDEKRVVARWS